MIFDYKLCHYYHGDYSFNCLNNLVCGDIYEMGVYGGNSLIQLINSILDMGLRPKVNKIWGLDSFCGLPPEQIGIKRHPDWYPGNFSSQDLLNADGPDEALSMLSELFNKSPIPVTLIPIWFKDLSKEVAQQYGFKPASYINMDCDLYVSAYQALDFFFRENLVKSGTLVRYDDFGGITEDMGERLAHAEITSKYNVDWDHLDHSVYQIRSFG